MATVRGMGVAVMTSRCGGASALARRASRCSTPKRCCSSTTTRPRSANCTVFWISACVPMTMPATPDAASSRACRRAAAGSEPVSNAIRVACSPEPKRPAWPRSPSMASIERACCAASTSVGASSAAWAPESMTCSIARSATTVLPEPTSPCSRRCIGWARPRSSEICAPTSSWPAVSVNGSRWSNASASPPRAGAAAGPGWPRRPVRRNASVSCTPRASSQASRRRAAAYSPRSAGRWMRRSAESRSIRPCSARTTPRQWVDDRGQAVQQHPHAASDRPRRQRRGGRVDGNQRAREFARAAVQRVVGFGVEQQVVRVVELALAVELRRPARRTGRCALVAARVSRQRLAEEGEAQPTLAVGDRHLEQSSATLAHRHDRGRGHRGHHRDVVADAQPIQRGQLTPFGVTPRVEVQQVVDRVQVRCLASAVAVRRRRAPSDRGRDSSSTACVLSVIRRR